MINRVTLLGRIGKKDYKLTKTGTPLCQLSVATEEKYIDSMGNQKKDTTWHNVNFFGKLAEVANKYTIVGDVIYIEGKISNRKIEENGVNRMVHSITANLIQFLPRATKDNNPKSDEAAMDSSHVSDTDWEAKEIPF